MRYFIKTGMAYGKYDLKHLTDHTGGERGYRTEVLGLSKEIDAAGYGPELLRKGETVDTLPEMKRYVEHAVKQEKKLKQNLAKGMPYYKWGPGKHQIGAKKIYLNATDQVLMRHNNAGTGHQFVINVGHDQDVIKAGNVPAKRAIRVVSPQPQGYRIHDKGGAARFTADFEKLLSTGKKPKKYMVKKTVRLVTKLK